MEMIFSAHNSQTRSECLNNKCKKKFSLQRSARRHMNLFLIPLLKLGLAIQIAVLNGFRDVIDLKVRLCLQVGDGAGDF
jgi:hypothetical protein